MSIRKQFGRGYIERELKQIADCLQTEVNTYLIGGGAMSLRNLKDTTKDIDLVVSNRDEYSRLMGTLRELGYEEVTDLGDEYDELGARHCVRNKDGCQLDLFNRQIANKLFFSDGMQARSEDFVSTEYLNVEIASLEDIFLFKSVAERPDDISDMATLVQTGLDFEKIESGITAQADLLGGERFSTIISTSLNRLDEDEGIQTPLDEIIDEYYVRYMNGYELRMELDEGTPRPVAELASKLDISESEVKHRFEYLEQYGFAEQTEDGLQDTGQRDEFKRS